MRRQAPWYRASKNAWYVESNGRQVRLGEHPESAPAPSKGKDGWNAPLEIERDFHRLMATENKSLVDGDQLLAIRICDLFLQWSELHSKPTTFAWHKNYIASFCSHQGTGRVRVTDLKPYHVTRWLDAHPRWTGARRSAVECVKRVFSWAETEGLISQNPLRKVKKDPVNHRDRVLSEDEKKQIHDAVRDVRFKEFVFAMQETGCRPSEVARVTADHFVERLGVWMFAEHKTKKKTRKARVVYLSPAMVELTKRLAAKRPSGPLFRGWADRPFTKDGIRQRFMRLRKKLPHLEHFYSYAYRHTYTNVALERGVGIAQVAELLGHSSTEMVMRHYGHLHQKVQHMRAMAAKASGDAA